MNSLKSLLPLCVIFFLSISCSSDDKDPEVEFNSLSASKTDLYIEDM